MASKPLSGWNQIGAILIMAFLVALIAYHSLAGTFARQDREWNAKGVTPLQETMWGPNAKPANVP